MLTFFYRKLASNLVMLIARHLLFYGLYNTENVIYRYIMFGRGICEKYQSRDEKFPEPNGEGNLVSRLVFFTNTPPKHDISV